MGQKRTPSVRRKPRADAERNRRRILEAAREAFTRSGANACLDDIASEAQVGPGTLYRHFPTREALLEAVYQAEVEKLAAAAGEFGRTLAPAEALRAWMLLFVDYIATKKLIAPALPARAGGTAAVVEASYARIQEAAHTLVRRAIQNGDLRKDVDPADLFQALIGVAFTSSSPGWRQSARRLVDILIRGSRPEG
ncbi:MAG: TetR/AcrR family transcriptional regulator [Terriglobales bacterium]